MDYIILCNNEETYIKKKRNFREYLAARCCDVDVFGVIYGFSGFVMTQMHFRQGIIDGLFKPYDRFMFMTGQQLLQWRDSLDDGRAARIAFIDNLGIEYTMSKNSVRIKKNDARYGYGLMLNYDDCLFGIMEPFTGAVHSPHTFDGIVDYAVPGSSKVYWDTKIVYEKSNSLDASTIKKGTLPYMNMKVKNVIFSGPATIVFWKDGTKTVAKCREDDAYSKEAGLAICFMKKAIGDRTQFQKVMKKWIPEISKTEEKNPREGTSFDEYINEKLKDPEFRKQYENTEIVNEIFCSLKEAADAAIEAMKRGDLESAGKIAEDYRKEKNNGDETTL